jgi:uncharacterized protein YfaS (alpha-2-macroglobulin family)
MLRSRWSAALKLTFLFVAAAALPGQMEEAPDDSTSFQISVNQAVRPGETVQVQLNGTRIRQLQFRLYRAVDPLDLFSQLDETNSFGAAYKPPKKPKTFLEKFNQFRRNVRAELRDVVRLQFTAEHRAVIRASRLQGEQKKLAQERVDAIRKSRKLTGEFYANVPLINPQRLLAVWQYNAPKSKETWQSDTVPVKLDEQGVYLLEATDAKRRAQLILFASRMVLLARGEHGKLDLRVVDATSGEPLSGAEVRLFAPKSKENLGNGATGSDGLASFRLASVPGDGFLALARRNGDFAAISVGGWTIGREQGLTQGVVYTDRPIYRPGHEVRLKAIVRHKAADGLQVPDDRTVRIVVNDSEGKPVLTRSAKLSDYGTVSTELKLPESAATGTYSIEVNRNGDAEYLQSVYGTFAVDEYRKPEYEVKLAAASTRVLQATPQRITLEARYYYGEPVRAGAVQWRVYRTRWYPPWSNDIDDEQDESGGWYLGEEWKTSKSQLGADGKATLDLQPPMEAVDQLYRVEAEVMDSSGRTIKGATSFLATAGPFYVSAQPSRYVFARGENAALRVTTTDYDGNPAPNAPFVAEVSINRWHKQTGLLSGGRGTMSTQLVESLRGQTGPDGHGEVAFTPREPGSYSVVLRATAPGGRTVQGHTVFSVSGNGESWGGEEGAIKIVADKRNYKPGDTARLLVVTGAPGCWVWVSVESRQVRWDKWVHMKEAAETVEVPIQSKWVPNVFVSTYVVRDGRFWRGTKMLSIPPADRTLAVKVTPAKREFRPGEPAQYDIEARDPAGRPVQAEVSLGVVDEPIYALERDPLPNLVKAFYDREWNQVTTASSLQWYFYAQAGRRSLKLAGLRPRNTFGQLKPERPTAPKIRKNFPDTAYWIADLHTGADGHARAQFEFPDSLTTWRATARAVTQETLLGSAIDKVLVRKRLVLSFATPRFAVEGDQVTVPVLVRNYLNRTQSVKLTLHASGADVEAAPQGAFDVQPNGEARYEWKLRAKAGGEIRLTGKAEAQDESDGLEIAFPVEPWGLPWHSGVSAALSGTSETRSLSLTVPASVRPESLHTMLSVAPSVAAEMLGSLEFLTNYPYGCTEQTLSSFLPNLVVRAAMKDLGAAGVDDAALDKMIRAGVKRLIDFQNGKGGWGFWRGDETDPFLTAYAAWGLSLEAQLRGAQPPYPATRGAELLAELAQQDSGIEPDLLAWEIHALSQAGVLPQPLLERLWGEWRRLSPQGLALLGSILEQRKDARAADIADRLRGMVHKDHRGASWSSDRDLFEPWSRDAGVEATAFALRFLARQSPSDPLLPESARWLAGSRDNGPAWNTTKRTAFALYGLTEYLRVSKELQPSFKVTVLASGRKVFEKSFSSADVFVPPPQIEVPAGVALEVHKTGAGTAYVSLDGSARLAGDRLEMPESGSGFGIARELYRLMPGQTAGRVTQSLVPLQGPVRVGEVIMMRLTVSAMRDQRYLIVDAPLPAGAEPVTRDEVYDIVPQPPWWKLSWSRRELRDSHALWFPWALPDGPAICSALIRFTNPGVYRLGAARVEAMYQPGRFRATEQTTLEVVEP